MGTSRSDLVARIEDVLVGHPVAFAMLFGSAVREDEVERGDVDIAVEFEDGVDDGGFSDAFLRLAIELEESLGEDVDVVPFLSMSPRFRSIVLEEGLLIVGTEERKAELERQSARDAPSAEEARERIAAAASRLTDGA